METLLSMSAKELSRLEVMQRLSERRMTQKEAGEILHLGTRQIKRLLRRYRKQGASGLVSKQRGRKSNNRLTEEVKKAGLNLLKTNIKDLVQHWRMRSWWRKTTAALGGNCAEADDRGRL